MPLYKTDAINLKVSSIGEADKLITLFSREYGKIRAVAKGAKRPASKFGGRLEVFTYNNLLLSTGKSLDIISQCETIESFYKLRESSDRLKIGVYFIRLVDLTTEDRQCNEGLFRLLMDSLFLLKDAKNLEQLARYFEVKLLDVEGLFPDLEKMRGGQELKRGILDLREKSVSVELAPSIIKDIGKIFGRLISEHIGRDVNKIIS